MRYLTEQLFLFDNSSGDRCHSPLRVAARTALHAVPDQAVLQGRHAGPRQLCQRAVREAWIEGMVGTPKYTWLLFSKCVSCLQEGPKKTPYFSDNTRSGGSAYHESVNIPLMASASASSVGVSTSGPLQASRLPSIKEGDIVVMAQVHVDSPSSPTGDGPSASASATGATGRVQGQEGSASGLAEEDEEEKKEDGDDLPGEGRKGRIAALRQLVRMKPPTPRSRPGSGP